MIDRGRRVLLWSTVSAAFFAGAIVLAFVGDIAYACTGIENCLG